ncbi:MAG: thioredoxin family protein [Cyclobacteriaceae bacterium]|nr:thioredoxin family protein [Cyclobacteriaceae bacterium HetDA_MAG_MS6]
MEVKQVSDSEFEEELSASDKVVVKYYADWCGSCRLFSPKYKRLARDEKFAGVTFLDINAEKSPEARKAAGVTNLPYFAVFKDGQLLEGVNTSKEEMLVGLLNKLN